ncbi:energy-coupling factor transporter ATPase [Paludifilum halophilum]|uniref:Energy-coupling factor transporter ATP-binding protein EcfA2 n=1 Tax=Paludifilum halophilum TaxID=1642702 RepID=A0A235B2H5_9BACL|nr:energy-coupling factor transporter ATPase [Paludifilum halophilum]OYD06508.1 energy-coupling factor transporter ATPase [Paludifilum halophilum]
MGIVIQGLSHIYMDGTPFAKTALSGINMVIDKGSFAGLIGPTGSGKSTLIQHIAGLLKPTKGTVRIEETVVGPETKKMGPLRNRVGLVFQYPEHQLFEESVAKDIAYGPHNQGLNEEEVHRRVFQAMEWVGLDPELSSRSPFQLSGGQMRRAAIAGVLAMQPEVLILDEPTAGLDPAGQRELLDTVYQLHREQGMTVILVSHSMEEIARYADILFVIKDGRLMLTGSPGEVFAEGERLREWGLEIPVVARLVDELNQRLTSPIPREIFTVNALERHLWSRWRKGEKG